jgi:acyl-coenzyme A thioesterase PaaI-like protein
VGEDRVSRLFQLGLSGREGNLLDLVAGSRPELANDRGGLHGGVAGLLGQHVALVALGVVRPDVEYRCVESRAVYLRPVPSSGAGIRCQVRVLHHGRRQAVVQTSLLDSRGNVAVEVGAVFAQAAGS